jgi:hypothetical protein
MGMFVHDLAKRCGHVLAKTPTWTTECRSHIWSTLIKPNEPFLFSQSATLPRIAASAGVMACRFSQASPRFGGYGWTGCYFTPGRQVQRVVNSQSVVTAFKAHQHPNIMVLSHNNTQTSKH